MIGTMIRDSTIENRLARFPPQRISAQGRAVSYHQVGAGDPVVFLHGIGSGGASWLQQLETWPSAQRRIAWDAPGYGGSTPLPSPTPSARDYAAALASFLDSLELDCVDLVGHSLGALMALSLAAHWPARVRRLILADPARGYGSENAGVRDRKLAERVAAMDADGPAGLARNRAQKLLSANAPSFALSLVAWNMSRLRPAGYKQASHMLAHSDILADAERYAGPALVLCGAEDIITPPAIARKVASALEPGAYQEIPNAGHASYVERPDVFNETVRRYTGR